jgi:CBS domain-containing protein
MSSYDKLSGVITIPVRETMRHPPVTVLPSESVAGLMYQMINENIGAVIVQEKEQVMGMITEKDVLDRVVLNEKDLYMTKAKDIMSKPILSIEADRPLKEALDLMRKQNVRRLAVTENAALVGIVSERRLLEKILSQHI